jgi:hypothetical protein
MVNYSMMCISYVQHIIKYIKSIIFAYYMIG